MSSHRGRHGATANREQHGKASTGSTASLTPATTNTTQSSSAASVRLRPPGGWRSTTGATPSGGASPAGTGGSFLGNLRLEGSELHVGTNTPADRSPMIISIAPPLEAGGRAAGYAPEGTDEDSLAVSLRSLDDNITPRTAMQLNLHPEHSEGGGKYHLGKSPAPGGSLRRPPHDGHPTPPPAAVAVTTSSGSLVSPTAGGSVALPFNWNSVGRRNATKINSASDRMVAADDVEALIMYAALDASSFLNRLTFKSDGVFTGATRSTAGSAPQLPFAARFTVASRSPPLPGGGGAISHASGKQADDRHNGGGSPGEGSPTSTPQRQPYQAAASQKRGGGRLLTPSSGAAITPPMLSTMSLPVSRIHSDAALLAAAQARGGHRGGGMSAADDGGGGHHQRADAIVLASVYDSLCDTLSAVWQRFRVGPEERKAFSDAHIIGCPSRAGLAAVSREVLKYLHRMDDDDDALAKAGLREAFREQLRSVATHRKLAMAVRRIQMERARASASSWRREKTTGWSKACDRIIGTAADPAVDTPPAATPPSSSNRFSMTLDNESDDDGDGRGAEGIRGRDQDDSGDFVLGLQHRGMGALWVASSLAAKRNADRRAATGVGDDDDSHRCGASADSRGAEPSAAELELIFVEAFNIVMSLRHVSVSLILQVARNRQTGKGTQELLVEGQNYISGMATDVTATLLGTPLAYLIDHSGGASTGGDDDDEGEHPLHDRIPIASRQREAKGRSAESINSHAKGAAAILGGGGAIANPFLLPATCLERIAQHRRETITLSSPAVDIAGGVPSAAVGDSPSRSFVPPPRLSVTASSGRLGGPTTPSFTPPSSIGMGQHTVAPVVGQHTAPYTPPINVATRRDRRPVSTPKLSPLPGRPQSSLDLPTERRVVCVTPGVMVPALARGLPPTERQAYLAQFLAPSAASKPVPPVRASSLATGASSSHSAPRGLSTVHPNKYDYPIGINGDLADSDANRHPALAHAARFIRSLNPDHETLAARYQEQLPFECMQFGRMTTPPVHRTTDPPPSWSSDRMLSTKAPTIRQRRGGDSGGSVYDADAGTFRVAVPVSRYSLATLAEHQQSIEGEAVSVRQRSVRAKRRRALLRLRVAFRCFRRVMRLRRRSAVDLAVERATPEAGFRDWLQQYAPDFFAYLESTQQMSDFGDDASRNPVGAASTSFTSHDSPRRRGIGSGDSAVPWWMTASSTDDEGGGRGDPAADGAVVAGAAPQAGQEADDEATAVDQLQAALIAAQSAAEDLANLAL